MDREKVKQKLLEEFRRRNMEPPQWIDSMVIVIHGDPRCTWSEKRLKECVESAVDAYVHEQIEREVVRAETRRRDPFLENCEYVAPDLYLCDDRYFHCWTDYEGEVDCMEVDEKTVDDIILSYYNMEEDEEKEVIWGED